MSGMSDLRRMLFVGGCAHGRFDLVNARADAWVVPKPIRFSFTESVADGAWTDPGMGVETYRPRTLFVGPTKGHEGPHHPMRMMVADEIIDGRQVAELMALDGLYPRHRAEAMRLAIEHHERRAA